MERKTAAEYDPATAQALYDRYVHGDINRRQFLDDAARFAIGGLTAAALLDSLTPNYAFAQQVAADDETHCHRVRVVFLPAGTRKDSRRPRTARD